MLQHKLLVRRAVRTQTGQFTGRYRIGLFLPGFFQGVWTWSFLKVLALIDVVLIAYVVYTE